MIDGVDLFVDRDRLHHVVVHEREVVVPKVLDILERGGLEVVDADHVLAFGKQEVAEMRAEKPGSPGDDRSGHGR